MLELYLQFAELGSLSEMNIAPAKLLCYWFLHCIVVFLADGWQHHLEVFWRNHLEFFNFRILAYLISIPFGSQDNWTVSGLCQLPSRHLWKSRFLPWNNNKELKKHRKSNQIKSITVHQIITIETPYIAMRARWYFSIIGSWIAGPRVSILRFCQFFKLTLT